VSSTPKGIPTRLRAAREQAGLSQGQAARLLEMHRPTITEIEAGRRRVQAEELSRFAKLYKVTVSWLTEESPDEDAVDPRVELAARELSKLKQDDLDRVLKLLSSMREAPKGRKE
jgi:transcriptional regulator with XRE-family HTH domain